MDQLDEKLWWALRTDGRASYSDLASQLGLTRAVVSARMGRLLTTGEIRIVAAVHPRLLGLSTLAHVAIRVSGPLDSAIETVTGIESVVFLSETTGVHQLVAEIRSTSTAELANALARIRACPGVVDVAVLVYERVVRSLFLGEEPPAIEPMLDDIDIALMSYLQRDGRAGFAELGSRVGLSPSAARTRVLQLVDANVMQIGAIRRRAAGNSSDVLFGLGITEAGQLDPVISALIEQPGLEFLANTIGRYTLVATLSVASMSGLSDVLAQVRTLQGVGVVDTWIHSTVHVERYDRVLERLVERP
jgi:DNA-binding Lrp family transcriptional regulator